jgi:hypothetical protein
MARMSRPGLPSPRNMLAPRLPTPRAGKRFATNDGPYVGMCDSQDLTATKKPRKANLLQNIYPQDSELGGGLISRPGFQTAGAVLGIAGHTRTQGLHQYTKKDGSQFTVGIAGGRLYTFNWGSRTWTNVVTTAQLTAAAITIDPDARVSLTTFANLLYVHDGIHAPWTWDGTTGGGLTSLAGIAPVMYGPMATYYNKIMGVKATDRLTMVWCEEAQPGVGYDTGQFADWWTIGQSDPGQLTALLGTNGALNVFRAESSTAVTGAVDVNFKSNGTLDGNESIGTLSPWAVLSREEQVFFLDRYGRPHVGTSGGRWENQMWEDFRESLATVAIGSLGSALAVDYTPASLVIFGLVEQGQTDCSMFLVLRVSDTGAQAAAIWRGFTASSMAMVLDGAGNPTLMHGDATGQFYDHGNPGGGVWDDYVGSAGGSVAVLHILETGAIQADTMLEKIFDRLDLLLRATSDLHATVQLVGPSSSSPLLNLTVTAGQSKWDLDEWDLGVWSPSTLELHTDAGFGEAMRWAKVRVSHQQLGETFGLSELTLSGQVLGPGPEIG